MTVSDPIAKRVGQMIEEAATEWLASADGPPELIGLRVRFATGNPLVLRCRGDGSIASRKEQTLLSSAEVEGNDLITKPYSRLAGATLVAVSRGEEALTLQTSAGAVVLRNDCDSLVLDPPI